MYVHTKPKYNSASSELFLSETSEFNENRFEQNATILQASSCTAAQRLLD